MLTVSSAPASSDGSTGTKISRTWRLTGIPRCTEMSNEIIAKLRTFASTNAPNTTRAKVRLFVSRSVTGSSASIPRAITSGITE